MKRESLIAYTMNFISFLLDEKISKDIARIILFGSVARGDYNDESDIDLFIDTKANIEKEVGKILSFFNQSEIQKKWELKGLKNELSLKVGNLEDYNLKRSIISDGVILYGKFKDIPEKVEYYLLFSLSFKNIKKSKQ